MEFVKNITRFVWQVIVFVVNKFGVAISWWNGKVRNSKSRKGAIAWFVSGLLVICFGCSLLSNAITPSSEDVTKDNQENLEVLTTSISDNSRSNLVEDTSQLITNTPKPTNTSAPTNTPTPTNTPKPTKTSAPTNTPTPTNTPKPTNTPIPTNTPKPTNTPAPTNTPKPTNTPIPINTSTPRPPATNPPPPPATNPPPAPAAGVVRITYIFYDGVVSRVESDEYAVVTNQGGTAMNLGGWRLNAGNPGQDFNFPSFDLQPGQSCRIYTNESHPDSCGFNFGNGQALWNNGGDCGYLYDSSGTEVSNYCY